MEVIIINSEKDILEAYDEAEKAKEKNQLNEILRVDDGGSLGHHAEHFQPVLPAEEATPVTFHTDLD